MPHVKTTALGIKNRITDDRLSLVAAGVAFYAFLSLFPALATVISIYGLVADAQTVQSQVGSLTGMVPQEVAAIIERRLSDLATSNRSSLTFGLVFGILLSLWSANRAMKAISQALNIAYDKREDRGLVKVNIVTLALTLISSLVFIIAIGVVVVVPIIVSFFLSVESAKVITSILSWLVLFGLLVMMFLILYRYAPAQHKRQSWRRLLPGALASVVLFVLASLAFSFYVSNFGKYDKQYGALGAVVVTMLWMFIGAFIFLLGAELNAERDDPKLLQKEQNNATR